MSGFLGTGWKFPLQVDQRGAIATSSGEDRVVESIYSILGTAKGERVMMPEYGCAIHDLVFAPDNPVTGSQVAHDVREALTRYEHRIDLLDVSAESSPEAPNLLLIRVSYRIRANNALGNLVYPFFITEGR